jgi:putative transposase
VTRRSIVIRLVEGQRVMGWREALNQLDIAYLGRLR